MYIVPKREEGLPRWIVSVQKLNLGVGSAPAFTRIAAGPNSLRPCWQCVIAGGSFPHQVRDPVAQVHETCSADNCPDLGITIELGFHRETMC